MINLIDHHDPQGTARYNPSPPPGFECRIEGAFPFVPSSSMMRATIYRTLGGGAVAGYPVRPSVHARCQFFRNYKVYLKKLACRINWLETTLFLTTTLCETARGGGFFFFFAGDTASREEKKGCSTSLTPFSPVPNDGCTTTTIHMGLFG